MLKQGIARALVSRHGLTPDEAQALIEKHATVIAGATIYDNAERIIQAEASTLPTPKPLHVEATAPALPSRIPKTKSKAQESLKPFIKLGGTLVPLHSEKEVKQMKREGFEIIMQ